MFYSINNNNGNNRMCLQATDENHTVYFVTAVSAKT